VGAMSELHQPPALVTAATCPCCGQPVAGRLSPSDLVRFLRLPPRNQMIVRCLARHFGEFVPREHLIAVVWPGPDGGPLTADNTLRVHLSGLRRQLKTYGFTIEHGYDLGYRLAYCEMRWSRAAA